MVAVGRSRRCASRLVRSRQPVAGMGIGEADEAVIRVVMAVVDVMAVAVVMAVVDVTVVVVVMMSAVVRGLGVVTRVVGAVRGRSV